MQMHFVAELSKSVAREHTTHTFERDNFLSM